jgi:hypothetical protein
LCLSLYDNPSKTTLSQHTPNLSLPTHPAYLTPFLHPSFFPPFPPTLEIIRLKNPKHLNRFLGAAVLGCSAAVKSELKIPKLRNLNAPFGSLPDLKSIDWNDVVIFTCNGITSGFKVPISDWIPADSQVGALVILWGGGCVCVLPERARRAVDKRLEVFCC